MYLLLLTLALVGQAAKDAQDEAPKPLMPGTGTAAVLGAPSPQDRWFAFEYLGHYDGPNGAGRFTYSKVRSRSATADAAIDYGVLVDKLHSGPTGVRGTDEALKGQLVEALAHPIHTGPCPGPGPCPNPKPPDRKPEPFIPNPFEPRETPLEHWMPAIVAGVLLVFTGFLVVVGIGATVAISMRKPRATP